jgi:hypothetical protein
LSDNGNWSVVQQGMHESDGTQDAIIGIQKYKSFVKNLTPESTGFQEAIFKSYRFGSFRKQKRNSGNFPHRFCRNDERFFKINSSQSSRCSGF